MLGEGSNRGAFIEMAAGTVHQAQKEEVVNGELRYIYSMSVPSQDANVTLLWKPTEF